MNRKKRPAVYASRFNPGKMPQSNKKLCNYYTRKTTFCQSQAAENGRLSGL